MTASVFDSSVIVAGAGWRGEAHLCLVAMARRRVRVSTSDWILEEAHRAVRHLLARRELERDPLPILAWFADKAQVASPAPVGKQRSRDPKDDPILGTALASGAGTVVSFDKDLLVLGKPFGIAVLRPREFLALLQRPI
ncbi:MAG TPA: putative toxin-antitoxin system toxin component, PIN family [Dongiaceae bacterium]|nr:putative toxin-antitoxin system toxin component, PIN family [Dongiaceae bacterium]